MRKKISKGRLKEVSFWNRRSFLLIMSSTLILFLVFSLRTTLASRRHYEQGVKARAEGNSLVAILHFRHAIESYSPTNKNVENALKQLMEIAGEREEKGDKKKALFAARSARVGLMATRHLWQPYRGEISELNRRIARLMTARDETQNTRLFQNQLDSFSERRRNPLLGFLGSVFFVTWICSLAILVWKGFDREGKPTGLALPAVAISAALLVGWVVMVRFA